MATHSRLVIVRGPGVADQRSFVDYLDTLLDGRSGLGLVARDFHSHALNDDTDPFASRYFGAAVRTLLRHETVVVTDRVFDDPQRRTQLELAFRQVLPDLVVEHVELASTTAAASTGRAVSATELRHPGIVLDDDVYGEHSGGSYEHILVTAEAPPEVLATALTSAGQRMMSVGEDGLEYEDAEDAADAEIYTPNYVSDVVLDADGTASLYMDCKGAIEPPMAARFREILVEEFVGHGITRAHVRVPD